jgi:osmotically-inducible protein OsmY
MLKGVHMKTDQQIKQDVELELEWDPAINATGIGVEVKQGIVTLAGHLSSYAEKLAAEKAAQRIRGVKAVVIELDVRIPNAQKRSDADIAASVRSVLQWTVGLKTDDIAVMVEKGCVALSGEVQWGYQKHLAETSIARIHGVSLVINRIRVHTESAPANISQKIADALERHAQDEAKHIAVSVADGKVVLRGKVSSFSEKALARTAAWSAPGVHEVSDELSVGI